MSDCIKTKNFIERAIKIHGDKYDYSKVKYKNSNEKIIIICNIYDDFLQTPYCHINNKYGCRKCGIIKRYNKNDQENFM